MEHPESGLADKVIGIQFSQKIEVRDPYTKKKEQQPVKPFMVNNSVNLFEKGKIILDGSDKDMITELEEYRVKAITSLGLPQYTDENEHAIDAMNLCLLTFAMKYDSLLRKVYATKVVFISGIDDRDGGVKSRNIGKKEEKNKFVRILNPEDKNKVISVSPLARTRRNPSARNQAVKRRTF